MVSSQLVASQGGRGDRVGPPGGAQRPPGVYCGPVTEGARGHLFPRLQASGSRMGFREGFPTCQPCRVPWGPPSPGSGSRRSQLGAEWMRKRWGPSRLHRVEPQSNPGDLGRGGGEGGPHQGRRVGPHGKMGGRRGEGGGREERVLPSSRLMEGIKNALDLGHLAFSGLDKGQGQRPPFHGHSCFPPKSISPSS